jgi:hypothetical protein
MHYPTHYGELEAWSRDHGTTPAAARLRFIKFCALDAVASDPWLSQILVLRGSGALQLFYGGHRECADLDLVILQIGDGAIDGDGPDSPKGRLGRMLGERFPVHFGAEEAWEEWMRVIKIQLSNPTYMYDFRRFPLTDSATSPAAGKSIFVATPEVLVAEKLVALARHIREKREKRREHDVYDIADLLRPDNGIRLVLPRVKELVDRRATQHNFEFHPSVFDDAGKQYVRRDYDAKLREATGAHFIEFEPAWTIVGDLAESVVATSWAGEAQVRTS